MAYDQKHFEYQMGHLHGYVTGPYGNLGANTRMQPPKPWSPPPPAEPVKPTADQITPKAFDDLKLTLKPSRPETEFERMLRLTTEKAEAEKRDREKRRVRQLNIITRKPRRWLTLKRHVHSFLDDTGRPFLDDDGEFRLGEVVPHKEHLRRLRSVYLSHWADTLENACTSNNFEVKHLTNDAEDRLNLAKYGLNVSPVSDLGGGFMLALFHESRYFRWSWVRRRKEHLVRLTEYDRRMRLFFRRRLSGKYAEILGDRRGASLNGATMVRTFFESPRTGLVKPRKGRQFRAPRRATAIADESTARISVEFIGEVAVRRPRPIF
jgi:hypothetical protein